MLDLDRLLSALDLADLARQAGARLNGNRSGACPLHGGDNPTAFHLWTADDGRQMFTCFTKCGSGNALTFLGKWRGLQGVDLIREAAELARLPLADLGLTEQAAAEYQARERRRDVLDLAALYYQRRFRRHKPAIAYAAGRGFCHRALMRFGYSDGGNGLSEHLAAAGADLDLARQMGLLRGDGRDFTANARGRQASPDGWLIYVHRAGGRVDYLSGRAITPAERMPDPADKSRNLPSDRSKYPAAVDKQIYRADVRGDERVVIVEGQADAESLRQLGVSAWALCGTALSADDVRALAKRRAVWLVLDDDTRRDGSDAQQAERRQRAAERLQKLAGQIGPLTLVGAKIPAKDFNDWLQAGATRANIEAALSLAKPWIDWRVEAAEGIGPAQLDDVAHELAALIARLPDASRPRYYKLAGKALDLTPKELRDLMAGQRRADYILSEVKAGRICFLGEPLANWQAHIVKENTVDDGFNPTHVSYEITGRLASGEPLDQLDVLAEEFEAMTWLARWGVRQVTYVNKGRLNLLARAIKEVSMANGLRRERVYTYTGWTGEGSERAFLSASGRLHRDGLDTETRVDLGTNNMRHYALPEPPKREALKDAVAASLAFLDVAPRQVTAVLWAAMFAAPLTPLRSLNAVVWPYGPTQSGKSTLIHLALAHYGQGFVGPREFHAPIDWTSTVTALEGAMFMAKDLPLIIDDFAPQFTSEAEARELKKKAALVIRSVGNRSARGRANGDLTQRATRIPRGLVLSTSENPLVGQSIVGRMIYVTVSRGDVMREGGNPALDAAQAHAAAGLYSQAMSAYLQWLCHNWEALAEEIGDIIDGSARYARQEFPRDQSRLPDYYAILAAGSSLALRAFQDLGAITASDYQRQQAANSEAILEVVIGQADKIAAESPAQMFFRALDSLIERRMVYLAPKRALESFVPPDRADQIGWFDPDRSVVWLSLESCLFHAKKFWQGLDQHLDTPVDAMRRHVEQANVLARRDKSQVEVSVRLDGKTRRALEINCERVRELYGIDLHPGALADPADDFQAELV